MAELEESNAGPAGLSPYEVQLIRTALIGLATVGEKVTYDCLERPLLTGSTAESYFESEVGGQRPFYAMDAFVAMQTAILSGFDHARAFVKLIDVNAARSTALATVARGALETFARTWHLLDARDAPDFVHRHLSLLHEESRYPAYFNTTATSRAGDEYDSKSLRAHWAAELTRLGLPAPGRIVSGEIVGGLLDAALGDGSGKRHYSDLSGFAHGHRMAINHFVKVDDSGGIGSLVADRFTVVNIAHNLFSGAAEVMKELVSFFGSWQRNVDLVAGAAERGIECFSQFGGDLVRRR